MRVQVLGLCRFSYLGRRGFQTTHASLEARRAFLYDPVRLARRWAWFEAVTLPPLLAQTDPDFTLVIMTGPDLPEPYLSRLRDLANSVPQIELSLIRALPHHLPACAYALDPHREAGADIVAHFRQDDDDAVAVDYVARAREDFRLVAPLWQPGTGAAVDYQRGLMLNAQSGALQVQPRMMANAVAGLTLYLAADDPRGAVHIGHHRLAAMMPFVAQPDRVMFCRGVTGDNDSQPTGQGYGYDLGEQAPEALLRARFAIDPEALAGLAARMAGLGQAAGGAGAGQGAESGAGEAGGG